MMEKVSIIVPVYNTRNFLCDCVESLLGQTYENFELILVDDGSTDGSGDICDEYSRRDDRILVLHQENAGQGAARNRGLEIATGEYICFVDSDDYVANVLLETGVRVMGEEQSDIVWYLYQEKDESTGYDPSNCQEPGGTGVLVVKLEDALKRISLTAGEVVVWNKMYKKSLFADISFPEGKKYEDEFITYKILSAANRICMLEQYLYFYRITKSSTMRSAFHISKMDIFDAIYERMEYYRTSGQEELLDIEYMNLFNNVKSLYTSVSPGGNDEIKRELLELISENIEGIRKCGYLSVMNRVFAVLVVHIPAFMEILSIKRRMQK